MQYFFILGNHPTLSIAELLSVLPKADAKKIINQSVFIWETSKKIPANTLIRKLGGTIKIGVIDEKIKNISPQNIKNAILRIINTKEIKGKFKFGFSCYGAKKFNFKTLGMEIKKYLKEQGVNCRWVTSKLKTLSSVVIEQNKLTSQGIEIILIHLLSSPPTKGGPKGVLLGHTLAVQPFKELSFRDYGRPNRDDRSGMLPPKLAQIMINLAGIPVPAHYDASILDPFCGSGTILTEAMLMGYNNLIGSDISKKAIQDTTENINWLKTKFSISNIQYQLFKTPAAKISLSIKSNSLDAIITEPYLGPQRGKINFKKVIPELEKLYSQSLAEFKKLLKPNGKVVMVWPAFVKTSAGKPIFTNPNLSGFKIINPIPRQLISHPLIKLTSRHTLIYGRSGQKVWREIVVLTKN